MVSDGDGCCGTCEHWERHLTWNTLLALCEDSPLRKAVEGPSLTRVSSSGDSRNTVLLVDMLTSGMCSFRTWRLRYSAWTCTVSDTCRQCSPVALLAQDPSSSAPVAQFHPLPISSPTTSTRRLCALSWHVPRKCTMHYWTVPRRYKLPVIGLHSNLRPHDLRLFYDAVHSYFSAEWLASCLIYAWALLEYVNIIVWVRSVNKMLPSMKVRRHIRCSLSLFSVKNAKIVQLWV